MAPQSAPASPQPSASGTRPEGAQTEREVSTYVRQMFSRIAPRYDLLNHVLSFNLDKRWRRRTARRFRHILGRADARALDLCCGTGDLTIALDHEAAREDAAQPSLPEGNADKGGKGRARVYGSDFAHPMLLKAAGKSFFRRSVDFHGGCALEMWRIPYFEGDALSLPVPDAGFDLVTCAFGFRNLANYEDGLREMHRVLRPGGELGILEFAAPRSALFASLYRFYFTNVLPRVGGAISGNAEAYTYLPRSVSNFPAPEELRTLMSQVGFTDAQSEMWTFGVVALHTAKKR